MFILNYYLVPYTFSFQSFIVSGVQLNFEKGICVPQVNIGCGSSKSVFDRLHLSNMDSKTSHLRLGILKGRAKDETKGVAT